MIKRNQGSQLSRKALKVTTQLKKKKIPPPPKQIKAMECQYKKKKKFVKYRMAIVFKKKKSCKVLKYSEM